MPTGAASHVLMKTKQHNWFVTETFDICNIIYWLPHIQWMKTSAVEYCFSLIFAQLPLPSQPPDLPLPAVYCPIHQTLLQFQLSQSAASPTSVYLCKHSTISDHITSWVCKMAGPSIWQQLSPYHLWLCQQSLLCPALELWELCLTPLCLCRPLWSGAQGRRDA